MLTNVRLVAIGIALTVVIALQAPASEVRSAVSERSIYQLDSTWTDDAGRKIKLAALQGEYQILGFVFTQCGATCPMLVKSMQTHLRSLSPDAAKRTRLVLVTIDPEHDTPDVLRRYRMDMGLGSSKWTLLHGSAASVQELTAVIGLNYDRSENGLFVHSNIVTLLDPQGEILLQQSAASDWASIAERIVVPQGKGGASEGRRSTAGRVPAGVRSHSQTQEDS